MASVDLDLVRLYQITRILNQDKRSAASKIEELYIYVFQNDDLRHRPLVLTPPAAWEAESLSRGLALIREIAAQYVRLYQDPRELPVTHYKRQKRVAIHLDQLFGPMLLEAVQRTGRYWNDPDEPEPRKKDLFLHEPILFLKQEARMKGFPKSKKGGGVSLKALKERFELKLSAKGWVDRESSFTRRSGAESSL